MPAVGPQVGGIPPVRLPFGGRHDGAVDTGPVDLAQLVDRVNRLLRANPGRRVFVGIAGAPGSGKSTLASALVAALVPAGVKEDHRGGADPARAWIGSEVAHVPMDGFHLADVELARLGRAARKGAPDTFDAAGYVALLRRLRSATETVWAPAFDRDIDQPVAGALPIGPGTRVIVTEGNYLLLDGPGWADVRGLLDEVWFCDPDPRLRLARLIARHEQFGKPPEQARAWAVGPDGRNADVVAATRHRADLVLTRDAVSRPAAGAISAEGGNFTDDLHR